MGAARPGRMALVRCWGASLWILVLGASACGGGIQVGEHIRGPAPESAAGTQPGPETLIGTYARRHRIEVFDGQTYVPEMVDDCLSIGEADGDRLRFDLVLLASNAHLCTLSGEAQAVDEGLYLYSETLDVWGLCNLRLRVSEEAIVLEDVNDVCRNSYCGARASFHGVAFSRRDQRRPALSCFGPDSEHF